MTAQLAIPDGTPLVPGNVVGNKYRIDGCLGEGGMGVVLSATHLELDAPVAIKVVREEFAGSQDIQFMWGTFIEEPLGTWVEKVNGRLGPANPAASKSTRAS